MSWLKKMMGNSDQPEGETPREVDTVAALSAGDIVKFDFADQSEISNKRFTVEGRWTLSVGEGAANQHHFIGLVDGQQEIRLREVSAREFEVAISVLPEDVLSAFKESEIVEMLEADDDLPRSLKRRKKAPEAYLPWTAKMYRQEAFQMAYRFDGDFRESPVPTAEGSGEIGCDFYRLVSDCCKYALEFRIFDGGRTEVHFCVALPRRKIEEIWPAAGKEL